MPSSSLAEDRRLFLNKAGFITAGRACPGDRGLPPKSGVTSPLYISCRHRLDEPGAWVR